MSPDFADFRVDAIPEASKGTYRLPVPEATRPEELVDSILLATSDTTSKESIREELEHHLRDGRLSLPVLAARGREPGKTLVVTAGVHGDEYEGILAIHRIFDAIEPDRMRGLLLAVPVVTLPGFWLGSRLNPIDHRNMARVFPGSREGSSSERIAATLLDRVLRHASLYIDLHSAGRNYQMLSLCGYVNQGRQAAFAGEAAEHFDAPFLWEHPSISSGRTLTSTIELDIPSLYAETSGGGGATAQDVNVYVRGVANLLRFLDIADLPRAPAVARDAPARRLEGSGDLDFAIMSSSSGLYSASAGLGDTLQAGDLIGVVRNLDGVTVEEVRAKENGLVIVIRTTPRIYAGELVAALARESSGRDQ